MKKALCLVLVLLTALACTACGAKSNPKNPNNVNPNDYLTDYTLPEDQKAESVEEFNGVWISKYLVRDGKAYDYALNVAAGEPVIILEIVDGIIKTTQNNHTKNTKSSAFRNGMLDFVEYANDSVTLSLIPQSDGTLKIPADLRTSLYFVRDTVEYEKTDPGTLEAHIGDYIGKYVELEGKVAEVKVGSNNSYLIIRISDPENPDSTAQGWIIKFPEVLPEIGDTVVMKMRVQGDHDRTEYDEKPAGEMEPEGWVHELIQK